MGLQRRALLRIAILVTVLGGHAVSARSANQMRRELKRMVGYTIVGSTYLHGLKEGRSGTKVALLGDGTVFELPTLTLALPLSDCSRLREADAGGPSGDIPHPSRADAIQL